MKKIQIGFICILSLVLLMESDLFCKEGKELKFSDNLDQYHFCHRCGMAVKKSDPAITVTGVKEEPWYQCCPMCALMDIIETGQGNGTITAYCNKTGREIKITIENKQISKIKPESTILLVGGSCLKNKIFAGKEQADQFIAATAWAKKEMIKPVSKAFSMLKNKKKEHKRCRMCTTPLKGHEKTWFTIMTTGKKRMVLCCGHCGLFTMYKLKNKARRSVTPDFITGRLIDAANAFYVVGNDLVLCCFPSTISFESRKDAEKFQKEHGGEILTFQEAMANINKVMKK